MVMLLIVGSVETGHRTTSPQTSAVYSATYTRLHPAKKREHQYRTTALCALRPYERADLAQKPLRLPDDFSRSIVPEIRQHKIEEGGRRVQERNRAFDRLQACHPLDHCVRTELVHTRRCYRATLGYVVAFPWEDSGPYVPVKTGTHNKRHHAAVQVQHVYHIASIYLEVGFVSRRSSSHNAQHFRGQ